MELIRGLHNLRDKHRDCVATIGNFDGVHRGHQAVIDQTAQRAKQLRLPSVVITFEPQPQEFFQPDASPPRLTRLREKLIALSQCDIDKVLCLSFNRHLAALTAEEFVDVVLVKGLGVKHLIVGDDFRFGQRRTGDFARLKSAGAEYGFEVSNTHSFRLDKLRVSSTRIREALLAGNLELVALFLGRPYCMSGRVAHGDKRGRTIGFPTANIHLHRNETPVKGVYAVRMQGLPEGVVNGVANIGTRPTVDGTRTLLEVHLFGFERDIYGAHVEVCFVQKLRDEQRFESVEALKSQINRDAAQARSILSG